MPEEIWVPVVSRGKVFPGYEVSDLGGVRRVRDGKTRLLKPFFDGTRYLRVDLVAGGKRYARRVHNLVLESFAGPPPNGMEACHGEFGPLVNHLGNLSWGTRAKNMNDRARDGTSNRGERCAANKITEAEALEVRRLFKQGVLQTEIGRRFGIKQQAVSNICTRKTWAWLADPVEEEQSHET